MESISKNAIRTLPISIVIPTKDEEKWLPRLLKSIKDQKFQPKEVIVADISTDDTPQIAREFGAKVVKGGKLAIARNNGARASNCEVICFIDADCMLPHEDFLEEVYDAFKEAKVDIASTLFRLDDISSRMLVPVFIFNWYCNFKRVSAIMKKPFIESGFFMICTRDAFDTIGGFHALENGMPEDLFFSLTGIKKGLSYKVLKIKIVTSGRRYHHFIDAAKALIAQAIAGISMRSNLYDNEKMSKLVGKMYGQMGGGEE